VRPRTRDAAACCSEHPCNLRRVRNAADLPRRTRKPSRLGDRGRVLLIILAVAFVGLLLSARFLSGFFVDYLWHQSVGRTDVFWGVLGAKFTMFAMFAGTFVVLALLNLIIADRLAPTTFSANTHPLVERFHEFFGHRMRMFRFAVAVVFGLLFAAPAISRWQDWLASRSASTTPTSATTSASTCSSCPSSRS